MAEKTQKTIHDRWSTDKLPIITPPKKKTVKVKKSKVSKTNKTTKG